MMGIRVDKVVAALPDPLEPNTIYAVRAGVGFDLYFTDSTGATAHALNSAGGGGGGASYIRHIYVTDETSVIDTNSPAAARFFLNTHRYVALFDLSGFTQCRLQVNKQSVAGAVGYKLLLKYRNAGFSTNYANYSDIGTTEVSVAANVTNQILTTGWRDLVEDAMEDGVAVAVGSIGGDGVLDPQFGFVLIEFR